MKFKEIVPYKLRRALSMATIAGATLMPAGCVNINQEKTTPTHDTTYVWGENDWSQIWPADKVAASTDSASVRYVYLLNNGVSFKARSTTSIWYNLNNVINCATPKNRHKIRGAGILNEVTMGQEQEYLDSIKLANMGFKFGRVYHMK